jgi:hypothetical protein
VVKQCRVSFKDSEGVEHSVEVDARTLYEAVGLAIARFRSGEHVRYEPAGDFSVESREPTARHQLTRKLFDAWLERPGGSPREVALRSTLTELLREAPVDLSRRRDGRH